jgi:hypothetical protein
MDAWFADQGASAKLTKPNRPHGSGLVGYLRSIRVADASGAQFVAYEFRLRRFLKAESRFELDTGEILKFIDDKTFEILATGEHLVRV